MKITVEYESLKEFLHHHPHLVAEQPSRIMPPPEPAPEPPEDPELRALERAVKSATKPEKAKAGKPQEELRVEPLKDKQPEPEPVGPATVDPAGDDPASVDEIRAAFAKLIETDEGWEQGATMIDELGCQKFGDVVASGQLTELKKKLVAAEAM